MITVYLAGLISTEYPESLLWRERLAPHLERYGFGVLSPMRGKQDLGAVSKDGGLTHPDLSAKDITLRDYGDICASQIILAHLDSFGCPRPLVGTVAELAWAWDKRIPIVAIAAAGNTLMRNHPFISEFVAHYSSTEEDAVGIIRKHYSR